MITGTQIRSARAALRWSIQELADRAGVGARTIKRFEAVDGMPASRSSTLLESKWLSNPPASNSSARRPIGQGFGLFCLAERPNETRSQSGLRPQIRP